MSEQKLLSERYVVRYGFQHLIRCHLQLVLHVYRAGCQEGVNAGRLCTADGVPCRLDVLLTQRASEQMVAPRTVSAMAAMAAASPGEAAAKPASMISTLRASSCFATSIFSFRFMLQPGDCSPSRSVVSKILNCSSHGILSSPIQNFIRAYRDKKAPSLNPIIKRRSESSAVPLLLPQYGATPLCTSDNALPCNGGHPFPPTGPKDFQRTAPGRVSLLPDAALHQPAALCGQG